MFSKYVFFNDLFMMFFMNAIYVFFYDLIFRVNFTYVFFKMIF